MMQDIHVDKGRKELRTIEIDHNSEASPTTPPAGKNTVDCNFGPDMSGSDDDEASEVDSFILDENDLDDSEQGLETSKFLLAAETDGQGIQSVDPQTQARLEALLEAAGISKLSKDGKPISDPEVLRNLTSSVSSALDEAAQALSSMRNAQGQLVPVDCQMQLEAGGENESIDQRSNSENVADVSEEGESLLSLACSAGYYELAQSFIATDQVLLAMKANVEDRGIKGDCTPLMEAASGGHVDIVRLLLIHHADINAQSSAGNTPLHYGACGGFKDVVQELVLSGANVEIHNENGHTPLMEAASAGHVEVAKILLDHGAGINTHSNEFKESALTLACYKGHLEMVKFLLEAGADQEHKTDEMHTALMEASMDGHVEVARLLLDSGAQVNMPADSFESPLTLAACGGHIELASLLIERGANIEEVNDEGYTPLMEAAREGHEDMVALLLSQDADINAQTEETQETALTLACCGGFLEVADFLLRSGARIELGCSTPLMEAAQEGHLELVSFLLQSGASVEAQTGTGDTALTYACENGHTDVAEALLECGAKLEHESEGGRTPLMKAARAGHLCTVQFLISKGADVNRATTSNDHTVLSLACAGGHLTVVELLLQHNADINHKLRDGSTMVIEAAKGGHTQVVKLLLEWPNRFLVHTAADQLAQLSVIDSPLEEPRVPVQGLANIVPPSEPDSQLPLAAATLGKLSDMGQQNIQKSLAKRANGSHLDTKAGSKFCSPENFPQFISESGLLDDKSFDKVKQSEESARLLELSSHAMGLIDPHSLDPIDIAKFLALSEHGSAAVSCPDTCLQTVQAHLQQQQQQLLLHQQQQSSTLQLSAPPPPPPASTLVATAPGTNYAPENRGGGGGKIQGNKRSVFNKQTRPSKSSQHLQQPPPPPPPPPPSLSIVNSVNGQLLLPLSTHQQQVIAQNQPAMYQTEHYGALQEVSQIVASTSQLTLDSVAQRQALTQPMQQQISLQQQQALLMSQQQLLACPQLMQQQQELLLQQMLTQPNLQHQLQMQQNLQQQGGMGLQQPGLPSMASTQMTTAPAAHLSQQQQQVFSQQQQQAQQLLQQQLQQLKAPSASGNHTIAINKPQLVRKQQKVQTTTHTVIHQSSIVNVDGSLPPPGFQNLGVPGTMAGSLYSSVDVDSQTESNHDTALTLACAGGHAELVSLLLAKGADIEHRDKKGFTPLILSATAGHVDVVEILLDHSADIEAQSERTKDTPLSLACSGGRYEVVELLLNRGANKEHRNVSDYTPLSLAASGGYVNIIRLLLNYNAEINSRTGSKLGISPLMLAAMNGHTAAVKLLLDQGSDINAQIETNRNTALTLACFQGRHEVVSLLVDRKANIEHRAKTGLTPLMEAASGGYVEVGRVLLDKGADVNAPPVPSSRDTALTIAADKGHYRFVELLLHRGASVDVKNKKGNSPLWLACNGGHSDVVSLLVQADADIDSQDNRKVSCLMAAFRRGHIKVVKWMVKKVTQFPSENEIKRYIATITDKELQKKCNQCADVIVTAKDRQAAEANKNADSLLEEIKQEKEQAALKAEMASKRRERRRERKRKGKQKDDKADKDKDSGKNSSPEPDGESSRDKREEDEEEDDEEDDSNSEPTVVPVAVLPGNSDNNSRGPKVKNGNAVLNKGHPVPDSQQAARLPPNMTPAAAASTALESSIINGPTAATARATRDARKKQQKAARENRREASDQDSGLRNVKAELNKKQISQALQVTMAKVSTLIESVVTVTAISPRPSNASVTQVTSSLGHGVCISSVPKSGNTNSSPPTQIAVVDNTSSKESLINAPDVNGGNKTRTKKSNEIMKQSSTTGIGDLDDFGVLPNNVLKNFEKINGKTLGVNKLTTGENKKDVWIEDFKYLEKYLPNMVNNRVSSSPSPRKLHKKEEGWKEVVRKNVSKKLSVPGNVISRLIGKGGCNINAIRELSGAHVEVEKSKGNADRTVTIKGYPESIRHANSLINAMVEEPDKDITELLSRINKIHKAPVEKVSQQKTPLSISDFAIGTFTVPVTSTHSTSTIVKSTQAKAGKSGGSQSSSNRTSNSITSTMGPTIGAWQNPVPGQVLPASPRRSPQKQVTLNSSAAGGRSAMPAGGVEKASARQLVFVSESAKRATSPVSSASSNSAPLSFSTATTSTIRGAVLSSNSISSLSHSKPHEARINTFKVTMALTNQAIVGQGGRLLRPSPVTPRMEGMPLPIVPNSSPSHTERSSQTGSSSSSGQPTPGEYSPFNNNLFINFLTKKEEQVDKMDFASVAAAGVVTTSPSSQTNSNPVPASSNAINTMDPVQAKAPWFKIPQQVNTPPYRPEADINMAVYRMSPMGSGVTNSVQGMPNMNTGMMPMAPMNPYMDEYQMNQVYRYQYLNPQIRENFNPVLHTALLRMDMGAAGLTMTPGVFPQGMPGIPMPPGQPQLPQKEEYSKPHRPMTLPEIKGGLNPNAPEFQLPTNGAPMVNGFDRPSNMSGIVGMASMGSSASIDSSSSSPNPGTGLPNLHAGSMPPVMQSSDFIGSGGPNIQYLLQQVRPSGGGMLVAGAGGSPPQPSTNRLTSSLNMGPNSPPQSMMGPPGLSPAAGGGGSTNFLSQPQPQGIHSPMHNLPGGRPNSAPSIQPVDPGMMGAPRSGSPLPTRAPPLDQIKLIQPIGGERKKGSGRPGPIPNAGSYTNMWGYNGSAGGNMVYPAMPEAEEEVMEYGLQSQAHYPETGDGDHNSMGQPPAMIMPAIYGNGSYPMAPIFPTKEATEDTQTQPHWKPAMTSVPSDQGDSERWQSWNQ